MSEDPTNRAAELTDEDMEKATGGITVLYCVQCPACGHCYSYTSGEDGQTAPPCPNCNYRWDAPEKPGGNGVGAAPR